MTENEFMDFLRVHQAWLDPHSLNMYIMIAKGNFGVFLSRPIAAAFRNIFGKS
jgi:hypothetical protein